MMSETNALPQYYLYTVVDVLLRIFDQELFDNDAFLRCERVLSVEHGSNDGFHEVAEAVEILLDNVRRNIAHEAVNELKKFKPFLLVLDPCCQMCEQLVHRGGILGKVELFCGTTEHTLLRLQNVHLVLGLRNLLVQEDVDGLECIPEALSEIGRLARESIPLTNTLFTFWIQCASEQIAQCEGHFRKENAGALFDFWQFSCHSFQVGNCGIGAFSVCNTKVQFCHDMLVRCECLDVILLLSQEIESFEKGRQQLVQLHRADGTEQQSGLMTNRGYFGIDAIKNHGDHVVQNAHLGHICHTCSNLLIEAVGIDIGDIIVTRARKNK